MLSRVAARSYSTAAPVKLISREAPGNLSTVSVVVNNAGSKVGKSGIAHVLSKYNFLNNEAKSALRFTRESELLGGTFSTNVTRDAIILNTSFLRQDLPYYVEALGNVIANTSYRPHELPEIVLPVAKAEYEAAFKSNSFNAVENLHQISFRRGLGQPLYYDGTTPVSVEEVKQFASQVYTSGNVSIIASGVIQEDLAKFVGESAFSQLPSGTTAAPATELFEGKEARIRAAGESVAVIGVPVKKADFAKYETLAAYLGTSVLPGAASPLSKIAGADSKLYKYQDAGLFVVSVSNADAGVVASGIKAAKKLLENVTSSQLSGAVKSAQLSTALQYSFEFPHDVTVDASVAKAGFKLGAFNYVAVGNTDALPYINEL